MALEVAQGRMKKKVLGAQEALQGGVGRVIIADGRIENPISNALQGNGHSHYMMDPVEYAGYYRLTMMLLLPNPNIIRPVRQAADCDCARSRCAAF